MGCWVYSAVLKRMCPIRAESGCEGAYTCAVGLPCVP